MPRRRIATSVLGRGQKPVLVAVSVKVRLGDSPQHEPTRTRSRGWSTTVKLQSVGQKIGSGSDRRRSGRSGSDADAVAAKSQSAKSLDQGAGLLMWSARALERCSSCGEKEDRRKRIGLISGQERAVFASYAVAQFPT